jgi:predicted DCC family thiol-disulfide oxidoreductase YuxK
MSQSHELQIPSDRPVLLFDGECGLCVMLVGWLKSRRGGDRVAYLPLQAPRAQAYLASQGLPTREFDSLVFVPDWKGPQAARHLLRTDGLFAALRVIGGPLGAFAWLRVVPRPIRDGIYALVARLRHRLPGRRA